MYSLRQLLLVIVTEPLRIKAWLYPMPWSFVLPAAAHTSCPRRPGMLGSQEQAPFPSCSVLGLEHSLTLLWKFSSLSHRNTAAGRKKEEKDWQFYSCCREEAILFFSAVPHSEALAQWDGRRPSRTADGIQSCIADTANGGKMTLWMRKAKTIIGLGVHKRRW